MWTASALLNRASPRYSALMCLGLGPRLAAAAAAAAAFFFFFKLQVILNQLRTSRFFLRSVSHTPWWWKASDN